MKKKITLTIPIKELVERVATEYDLSGNYKFNIDKEAEIVTITDEEELPLPDIKILIEQSSARTAIANKLLPYLNGKGKEELTVEDIRIAISGIKNFTKSEKPKIARLKSFYEKYSDKKIEEVLNMKFSEVKERLGYNNYGVPSHLLLTTIFQVIGFNEDCEFFNQP